MPDLIEIGAAVGQFSDTIKVALYGKFGTRKTLQAGHLAEAFGKERVVIVSAEHGLNTIRSLVDPANVIECDNVGDLRKAHARVREMHNTKDWWVVIDGATRIFGWGANEQMSGADRYYEATATGKPPKDDDKQYGRFISDKSDKIDMQKVYGRIGRDSQNLLNAWVRLECNQYWTFLEDMTGTANREKTIPWGPDVPGKVALTAIMSTFDYVGRLEYDGERRLVAGFDPASAMYLARTREDRGVGIVVPPQIVNFNLATFVSLITGGSK